MHFKTIEKSIYTVLLSTLICTSTCLSQTFYGILAGTEGGNTNSYFGIRAGEVNTGGNNSFFGYHSGQISNANYNSFFGSYTGYKNINGYGNTFIGYESGRNALGSSNVFIGYRAGYNETGNNKLYIDNSFTDSPLIKGDFESNHLTFNGTVSIASDKGITTFKNVEHVHDGLIEDFISINVKEDSNNSVLISQTGRISIGTNDVCLRHTSDNDTTFLIVDGAALKYGDPFWQSASDRNLKKNINPLQKSLNKFLDLNFYSYQYNKTNQTRYGIIAQEMEKIFPHSMGKLIEEDGTEYLTFNPNNLFYTSLKASQEIGELTLVHETKIEQLEKENSHLKSELEVIKTALKNYGIDIAQDNTNNNALKDEVPYLLQNNPNPLNKTTSIPYLLTNNTKNAVIIINDLSGKTIEKYTLPEGVKNGSLEINLKPFDLSKGIYNYSLVIDGVLIATKQMLLN